MGRLLWVQLNKAFDGETEREFGVWFWIILCFFMVILPTRKVELRRVIDSVSCS